MDNHSFLKLQSLLLSIILFSSISCTTKTAEKKEKINSLKNVVMIIGYDHSAEVLGCYGNSLANTPNLDKLAAQGIHFTNAFANNSICARSRASLLTGKYNHLCGVRRSGSSLTWKPIHSK